MADGPTGASPFPVRNAQDHASFVPAARGFSRTRPDALHSADAGLAEHAKDAGPAEHGGHVVRARAGHGIWRRVLARRLARDAAVDRRSSGSFLGLGAGVLNVYRVLKATSQTGPTTGTGGRGPGTACRVSGDHRDRIARDTAIVCVTLAVAAAAIRPGDGRSPVVCSAGGALVALSAWAIRGMVRWLPQPGRAGPLRAASEILHKTWYTRARRLRYDGAFAPRPGRDAGGCVLPVHRRRCRCAATVSTDWVIQVPMVRWRRLL